MLEDAWKGIAAITIGFFYYHTIRNMEVGGNHYLDCKTCSYFCELSEVEK